ncbi:MAG TPA: peptidoglycan-binding protein [Chloroflexota bacterium]
MVSEATINQGATGDAVTRLQQDLQRSGFDPGGIDGTFGAKTEDAVRAFQMAHGLPADGVAGPQTWEALETVESLSQGSTGDGVRQLQLALQRLGSDPGASDGTFGSTTEQAVKSFQSAHGLTADGVVGPDTWGALESAETVSQGSSGDLVTRLQRTLQGDGFDPGDVDGTFGSKTEEAVRAFQTARGLQVDGIAGPETWIALDNASTSKTDSDSTKTTTAGPTSSTSQPDSSPTAAPDTSSVTPPADVKEKVADYVKEALDGAHILGGPADVLLDIARIAGIPGASWEGVSAIVTGETGGEAAGAFGVALDALEWASGIGEVAGVATVIWATFDAFGAGRDSKHKEGFCYGVLWGALNRPNYDSVFQPVPPATEEEIKQAFLDGVKDGRDAVADAGKHNRVVLAVAWYMGNYHYDEDTAATFVINDLWKRMREDDDLEKLTFPKPPDMPWPIWAGPPPS